MKNWDYETAEVFTHQEKHVIESTIFDMLEDGVLQKREDRKTDRFEETVVIVVHLLDGYDCVTLIEPFTDRFVVASRVR